MEEVKKESATMDEKEFEAKVKEIAESNKQQLLEDFDKGILHLRNYSGVQRFKSIRRAIRRGHISIFGDIYPKRPFNNKANTCKRKGHHSRSMNELKKKIYGEYKS